jgi:hypothetical protein
MSIHHDRIVRTMLESLSPGCPIVTADGEQIGTLAEVADEAVKVNAPLRRDFWIDADYVRSCDDGRIELSFIKQDLGVYKLDSYRTGDTTQPDDPLAEGKQDHVVSDSEQLETRLRMERQLAEQRHELPHLHPQGEDAPPDTFGTLGEPVESELARHGMDPASPPVPDFATAESRTGGHAYWRFLAVAAALIPIVAAVYFVRRRRR